MIAAAHVSTAAIRHAGAGSEMAILKALGIAWPVAATHIHCPYPTHDDLRDARGVASSPLGVALDVVCSEAPTP